MSKGSGGTRGNGRPAYESSKPVAEPVAVSAPKPVETQPVSPKEAFFKQAERTVNDVFTAKMEPVQDKMHNMMYSSRAKSVDENVSVSTSTLVPTQNVLYTSIVQRYLTPSKYEDNPVVATYKGKNYVIDGHHRVAAALLNGNKTIKVTRYIIE